MMSPLCSGNILHICYPVTAIDFSQPVYYCNINDNIQLQANVTMRTQNCVNHLVTFSSSDDAIATVDEDGFVNGVSHGTVTITATAESGVSATTEVQVHGPLLAHAKVDATCTETGTEAYWECDVCGVIFSDAEGKNIIEAPIVIAASHTLTAHAKVDATCTETGTEAFWECEVCGDLFSDEEAKNKIDAPVVISALGHDWNNAEYKWAKDNSTVTATRTCKNNASHIETETATVMAEITAPTETTEGTVI